MIVPYLLTKLTTLFWTFFYRICGFLFFSKLGKNCWFEGWVSLPQLGGVLEIGDYSRICKGVEFTIAKNAKLILGNNVFIGKGVVISSHEKVEIGAFSMLAEYVCIHDNNHALNEGFESINKFESGPVTIGNGNWLAAGVKVLKNVRLGEHVTIGAGSVVTKSFESNLVLAGVPAKILKGKNKK